MRGSVNIYIDFALRVFHYVELFWALEQLFYRALIATNRPFMEMGFNHTLVHGCYERGGKDLDFNGPICAERVFLPDQRFYGI